MEGEDQCVALSKSSCLDSGGGSDATGTTGTRPGIAKQARQATAQSTVNQTSGPQTAGRIVRASNLTSGPLTAGQATLALGVADLAVKIQPQRKMPLYRSHAGDPDAAMEQPPGEVAAHSLRLSSLPVPSAQSEEIGSDVIAGVEAMNRISIEPLHVDAQIFK